MRIVLLVTLLNLVGTAYAQSASVFNTPNRVPPTNPGSGSVKPPSGVPGGRPYGSLPMPSAAVSTATMLALILIGKKVERRRHRRGE